ncbi:adenosylcobinamide-phosphate synthase [Sphingomonas sp. PP-F2F-G114-C0414]|uniref:adenosylcobinamide-phosphate synthase CbiB n=1 Tax=Sphingomonas sp. PP-F2F-G114-C0414 TaxID=2135662 RepID=UPI000EF95979|nr:adenosylcobinamide-phosphate synthase CbiB [Sphingomonas sp. PP-F2F-G114-C0414]RMB35932.1 adenosylcobinamide-phosphate synthase [Sphingomonas sp. PP-F2F-G114-C0414]
MAEPVALVALVLDIAIGWPAALYARIGHPVGGFARLIGYTEKNWNRTAWSFAKRRIAGVLALVLLLSVTIATALALVALARFALGPLAWLGLGLLAAPGLAVRSLYDHVVPCATALEAGDLPAARSRVGMIVGRDVASLDESGVASAGIESLAESLCDGVVAPLFWLLVAGVPGLWAYKAINTADSLIGHREDRWRAFGWAAARTDDLANLIPARLSGILLCLVGGGWRTMLRDAGNHASPNAGWPEAAMAGALDLRLAGPIAYDGVSVAKPYIGDGRADGTVAELRAALGIYRRVCVLLLVVVGGIAWAL